MASLIVLFIFRFASIVDRYLEENKDSGKYQRRQVIVRSYLFLQYLQSLNQHSTYPTECLFELQHNKE